MVRTVMSGYDESDMNALFQSTRKKLRSTVIFIICVIIAALILFGIFVLPHFINVKINSAFSKPCFVAALIILGVGLYQMEGNSKNRLESYPPEFREGSIFTAFSNTDFFYAALHNEYVTDSINPDGIMHNLEKNAIPHYYNELNQIIEDGQRFYLFSKSKDILPLIIRKEAIAEGSVEELREIFYTQLKNDYKIIETKSNQEDEW